MVSDRPGCKGRYMFRPQPILNTHEGVGEHYKSTILVAETEKGQNDCAFHRRSA
jgi:hypothetical protein